jgi:stearoyl-CoA desaturase (Delta-9 desaturase)
LSLPDAELSSALPRPASRLRVLALSVARWFDSWAGAGEIEPGEVRRVDLVRVMPLVFLHLGCLSIFWTGWSLAAVLVAVGLYAFRMFAITGFYHRYFSHASFKASRPVQLFMAIAGATCVQRGTLWWAATHRKHHAHSDQAGDAHSPRQHGFWWSHLGWLTSRANFPTDLRLVKDLARHPELRFLDRFDTLVPVALAASLYGFGALLERVAPSWGTSGAQMLAWGFFLSTTVVLHASLSINSLAHGPGDQPFETRDDSRNSLWLALLTFGEGWHNNHHRFPSSARMGMRRREIDLTYMGLSIMRRLGLIHDLVPIPARARAARGGGTGSDQRAA